MMPKFRRLFLCCLCLCFLIPDVLWPVRSDAQVSLDGSLGTKGPLTGLDYVIPAEVGKQQGSNLFHSFGTFNVQQGESVTFTGPDSIQNVIARVTGGQQSLIDGPVHSDMPDANFYLLNPSGVLFVANASFDVGGAVHVSTADALHFTDGETFHASFGEASSFSVADPVAFGFLSRQPAPITVDQSALSVNPGHTLSLVGGDLAITGNPEQPFQTTNLAAPGGTLNLVSVAGEGKIRVNEAPHSVSAAESAPPAGGAITLSKGALVSVNGNGGGSIIIRGGRITLDYAVMNAATVDEHPGTIDIQGQSVELRGGAVIRTSTSTVGEAGSVTINATDSVAIVGSDALGNISAIFDNSFSSGNAGQVKVTTPMLTIDGGKIQAAGGNASSGTGGHIVISAKQVLLSGGGQLDASHFGIGPAGRVSVQASEAVKIVANTKKGSQSGLFSNAQGGGSPQQSPRADALVVTTPLLEMQGGRILSLTSGAGTAGDIDLRVGNLVLTEGAQIDSSSFADGPAGRLSITATDTVTVAGRDQAGFRSGLFSNANGTGKGNTTTVTAPRLIVEGGRIDTRTLGGGDSGDIEIRVRTLEVRNGGQIFNGTGTDRGGRNFQGIEGTGKGGEIRVQATDAVEISGGDEFRSGIFSVAQFGPGEGGNIVISAPRVHLQGDGTISVGSFGKSSGNAGDIDMQIGSLRLANGAEIDSSTADIGQGGEIRISAADVTIEDNGHITSRATGSGDAGNIVVYASKTFLADHATVSTDAQSAEGGQIALSAPLVKLVNGSRITTSVQSDTGDAGKITIAGQVTDSSPEQEQFAIAKSAQFVILDGTLTASAVEGQGGNINVAAARAFLASPESATNVRSERGISGSVDIQAPVTAVSGTFAPLPSQFLTTADLLQNSCAERIGQGIVSSFVIGEPEGLPLEPGAFVPSPFLP